VNVKNGIVKEKERKKEREKEREKRERTEGVYVRFCVSPYLKIDFFLYHLGLHPNPKSVGILSNFETTKNLLFPL
jgi:hypothetical protein